MVVSRWPWRLPLVALMSFSTSASVRYSRVRSLLFGSLLGVTVRFTMAGVTSRSFGLTMKIRPCRLMTVRIIHVYEQHQSLIMAVAIPRNRPDRDRQLHLAFQSQKALADC